MRRNQGIKSILLGILILLAIIQTTALWLGGFPGQSFFEEVTLEERGIAPFAVWVIKPSASNAKYNGAFAYRLDRTIENTRREYERLAAKLQATLRNEGTDFKKMQVTEGIQWEKLLSVPTIGYEYEAPLTLAEISGNRQEQKAIKQIDAVFVQSDTKFDKSLTIHLVSTVQNKMYTVETVGDFQEISKIYTYFTREELLQGITKYQPSALSNINGYVENNVFMPIASMDNPIFYDFLEVYNPIDLGSDNGMRILEKYVNDFFINPLLKDISYEEDGSIIFTEQKKNLVIYNPKGVIEYMNLAPKLSGQTTHPMVAYNMVIEFIKNTDVISENVKEGLYLSRIETKGQEISYHFEMAYDGYGIALSNGMKQALDIESLVKITVKQGQIINAKVCTLQFETKLVAGDIITGKLTEQYVDPINDALEALLEKGKEAIVFEDIDTVYLVSKVPSTVYLKRGVKLGNTWYYP